MKKHFEFAVANIARHGDTDIFPFPIENHIFFDERDKSVALLERIFADYDNFITKCPPINESMLVPSGYTGFRWATQIDPIWNAYFLGLVLSISEEIELARIPKDKECVFSYRINLDQTDKTLFDKNYGWHRFQLESIKNAKENNYVLICDISHFYSNIYHHRLENSLSKLGVQNKQIEKNIMDILQRFSNIKSYGLPIGGNASRILSELLLNRTDKLLKSKSIKFCRFVDDYHIFAKTEEELYENLLYLSKILIENEGLSLQKSKTRIMGSEEFIKSTQLVLNQGDEKDQKKSNLFSISLKYDPYSQTAEEDYEKLKNDIAKMDILGMLAEELNKSRIHSSALKKLADAIKYLDSDTQNAAIESLMDNLDVLLPVFPNIMILVNGIFKNLKESTKIKVQSKLYEMITKSNFIMRIELNLAYALRVLSNAYTDENEDLMIRVYSNTESKLIKRDIILIMAKWGNDFWLSDLKNKYTSLGAWEKRSFIISCFYLGDEGRHWRDHFKDEFSDIDVLYREWMAGRTQQKRGSWEMPI